MRALAAAALGFSAGVFLAVFALPLSWLIPMALGLGLVSLLLFASKRKWLMGAVLALLFCALGLLRFFYGYEGSIGLVKSMEGEARTISFRLTDWPETYPDYVRIQAEVETSGLPRLGAFIYAENRAAAQLIPGQKIGVKAEIRAADELYGRASDSYHSRGIFMKVYPQGPLLLEEADPGMRGILSRLNGALSEVMTKVFPEETAAFMRSLLLGDKTELYRDKGLMTELTRAGLMHIVAVSGMHVAFLVGMVQFLLGRGRFSALLCLALVWIFVPLTGASPSAVRAGVMQSVLLLAPLLGRENDSITSLALALALLLFASPFSAASISLQLSFAAMAGLILFSQPLYRRMMQGTKRTPGKLRRYIIANLSSAIGVSIATTGLTMLHFGYVPLLSWLSNILGLWAVSLCFCLGWAACLSCFVPGLGQLLGFASAIPAALIFLVAKGISAIPFAVLYLEQEHSLSWMLFSVFILLISQLFFRRSRLRWAVPLATAAVSLALLLGYADWDYRQRPSLTAVDVGQGLCVVAMSGEKTVVVDCGAIYEPEDAGEKAGRYLLSRGRNRVDLLALSSLDAAHANGAAMLMEMVDVKELLIPKNAEDSQGYLEELLSCAEEKGCAVRWLDGSGEMQLGSLGLGWAEPDRRSGNGYIYSLHQQGYDSVIFGDSHEKESYAAAHDMQGTDLIVLGGRGWNKGGSRRLWQSIGGRLALISRGGGYADLDQETLEGLKACGYNVYMTDRDGTVELRSSAG